MKKPFDDDLSEDSDEDNVPKNKKTAGDQSESSDNSFESVDEQLAEKKKKSNVIESSEFSDLG